MYFKISTIQLIKLVFLDAMGMVKLNTFHWHICDSQSFPLVLKSHPELSRLGAYSSDKVYTADDISEVINTQSFNK